MASVSFSIIFLATFIAFVQSIPSGQRMSIQKVPFMAIVIGVGRGSSGPDHINGGIVLDERVVLTHLNLESTLRYKEITVGISEISDSSPWTRYSIKRNVTDDKKLLVLYQINDRFLFTDKVQRATLPLQSYDLLKEDTPLMVAGYGDNMDYRDKVFNNGTALHGRQVFVNYDFNQQSDINTLHIQVFAVMGPQKGHFSISYQDRGGPCWDPATGIVLGFLRHPFDYTGKNAQSKHQGTFCVSLAPYRDWIQAQRLMFNAIEGMK